MTTGPGGSSRWPKTWSDVAEYCMIRRLCTGDCGMGPNFSLKKHQKLKSPKLYWPVQEQPLGKHNFLLPWYYRFLSSTGEFKDMPVFPAWGAGFGSARGHDVEQLLWASDNAQEVQKQLSTNLWTQGISQGHLLSSTRYLFSLKEKQWEMIFHNVSLALRLSHPLVLCPNI